VLCGIALGAVLAAAFAPAYTTTFTFNIDNAHIFDAPCAGRELERCRQPQDELQAASQDVCAGEAKRVCLVPVGQVDPELMDHLVAYYQDEYGLAIAVLDPVEVPLAAYTQGREQAASTELIEFMLRSFPEASGDPDAVLIGVTPVDMFSADRPDWRYVFGTKGDSSNPEGMVSTFRMNPETYGEDPDDDKLFSRARKMLTKYIGVLYYGLPESSDPTSPLYNSILGPDDLDRMDEPLPVDQAR
jgi:predicted Zn-dependent protease